MDTTSASDFTWYARQLATAARNAGLLAPGFKSPPTTRGQTRAVRRLADGNCLVMVQIRGRAQPDVVSDMIDGIVLANRLTDGIAEAARRTLRNAIIHDTKQAA